MTTKAVTCSWDRERFLALLSVFGKSAAVKCLCCTISSSGIALWHRFLESFKWLPLRATSLFRGISWEPWIVTASYLRTCACQYPGGGSLALVLGCRGSQRRRGGSRSRRRGCDVSCELLPGLLPSVPQASSDHRQVGGAEASWPDGRRELSLRRTWPRPTCKEASPTLLAGIGSAQRGERQGLRMHASRRIKFGLLDLALDGAASPAAQQHDGRKRGLASGSAVLPQTC